MTVTVTEIGTAQDGTSAGSITITTTAAVAAGDTIVIMPCSRGGTGQDPSSITDSASNAWTKAASAKAGSISPFCGLWYVANAPAMAIGSTITVTWAATVPVATGAIAITISGLAASSFDIATANGASTSTTTPTSGDIATTNAADILIGCIEVSSGDADGFTEGSNFTTIDRLNNATASNNFALHAAYRIVSSTGTYAYQPTLGASRSYVDIISSFKQASAGAPGARMSLLGCGT